MKKLFALLVITGAAIFCIASKSYKDLYAAALAESRGGTAYGDKNTMDGTAILPDKILADSGITFWSDYPDTELSNAIVERMTDEELYAQTLMFGWAGAEPSALLYKWVERGLGSVKVFGWNTDNLQKVAISVSSLQDAAGAGRFAIPLFVATDQEGGSIRHIKGQTTITPGPMALGASAYPSDAWLTGYYIGREIKALGINMNFAPSIDLFTNRSSQIIGPRSLGDDSEKVAALGAAFAGGMAAAGVIPCPKHFPGHGDTAEDSHSFLPVINISKDTFTNRELFPFRVMSNASKQWRVSAMMSGHLSFPNVDGKGEPASLSHYFLTDLLRGQLGFDGIIVTDDLMMNGDTAYAGSVSKAFRMAMEAGNDILIASTTAGLSSNLWTDNLRLMKTTPAFKDRVKDAARRIIKAKLAYFKGTASDKSPAAPRYAADGGYSGTAPLHPDPDTISSYIPDKDGEAFFLSMACRSVTAVKGASLAAEDAGRMLLAGSLPEFFQQGKAHYKNTGNYRFSFEPGPNETQYMCDHIKENAAGYNTVICLVANAASRRIAQTLRGSGKKVIILSIMSPEYAIDMTWADTILLGYGWSGYTMTAMFSALAGEYEPKGELPYSRE